VLYCVATAMPASIHKTESFGERCMPAIVYGCVHNILLLLCVTCCTAMHTTVKTIDRTLLLFQAAAAAAAID
jgi:hypothetical protein